ncbi:hypothetical protein QYE76_005004 [Lolium multiflorum]|uniref:Uncharacterized protein n=1 Tax=Lolium multiflorum TaxID=4521 RepID=A0AAD8RTW7_LOLMU|nr:hypothetical protein QYE76_005004 [Lolium multiflorum]
MESWRHLMTAIACGWIERLVGAGGDISTLLGEMDCVGLRPGFSLVEKAVALYWDRSERARAVEVVRDVLRRGSVGAGADYDGETGGPIGYLAWKMMLRFLWFWILTPSVLVRPGMIHDNVSDKITSPPADVHGQQGLLLWLLEWFSSAKDRGQQRSDKECQG